MKNVLSIFAITTLLFTGACSTGSLNQLLPNQYYPKPAGFQPSSYANGYEHMASIFQKYGVRAPSNFVVQVSWYLTPGYNGSEAVRRCEKVYIKDEYGSIFMEYPCLSVVKNGDYLVTFQIGPDKGPGNPGFNLSYFPGGRIIEGAEFEPFSFIGFRWTYEDPRRITRRIVWSSHKPVSWQQ